MFKNAGRVKRTIEEYFVLTVATLILVVGVYVFKFPNNFSFGGVTGIAVVLSAIMPTTPGNITFIINMALLVLGFIFLGKSFGIKTVYVSVLMSVGLSAAEKWFPMSAPLTSQSFFDGIPGELEEAASIDGSGRFYTLFHIIMPLVVPGLLAVGVYSFLMTWDDYLHAITLIRSNDLWTLSQGLKLTYLGEVSDWQLINSASTLGTVPMIFVFFFFQKYMIKGLTAGAVKG